MTSSNTCVCSSTAAGRADLPELAGVAAAFEVSKPEWREEMKLHAGHVVHALDPVEGRGDRLAELDWLDVHPVVSPDGRQLAYRSQVSATTAAHRLKILTLSNGGIVTLDLPGTTTLSSVEWAADGQGLYVGHENAPGQPGMTLSYVPPPGRSRGALHGG